jgi:hypothetical protein
MSRLAIEYGDHERVCEVVDRLTYCAEWISVSFDGYEEPHVKGPGLYFAVIGDSDYGAYADPMGENRWPRDDCASVFDEDAFAAAAESVSVEQAVGVGRRQHFVGSFDRRSFADTERTVQRRRAPSGVGRRSPVSHPRASSLCRPAFRPVLARL